MLKPLGNKIMLEIDELKFGAVTSDSIAERGKIIELGPYISPVEVRLFKIGATLYFKAWAVDIITDPEDGKKYYFISSDSDAICGIK